MINVRQLEHKNQYLLTCETIRLFQSYNTLICAIDDENKKFYINVDAFYSNTTCRHLSLFIKRYGPMGIVDIKDYHKLRADRKAGDTCEYFGNTIIFTDDTGMANIF